MKLAYVFVPGFVVAVERKRHPELADKALIVGGLPHERHSVHAVSPEAAAAGVRPGMTSRQASYLCPEAAFLPLDREHCAQVQEALLAALETVSPAVEADGWGAAYLDDEGLELLYGDDPAFARRVQKVVREQVGLEARVGIAQRKLVARMAAHLARDAAPLVVASGKERAFLENQPIGLLSLGEETRERLQRLGIRTIGGLLRLPSSALAERVGGDALAARQALTGGRDERVAPRPQAREVSQAWSLDFDADDPGKLLPIVSRIVEKLAAQLQERGQACRKIDIRLEDEASRPLAGTTLLKEATADPAELKRAAAALLERLYASEEPTKREYGIGNKEYGVRDSDADVGASPIPYSLFPIPSHVEVTLGNLEHERGRQLALVYTRQDEQRRRARLDRALTHLHRRFGEHVQQGVVLGE